ncbi:conserved repeat domain-containing protein [Halomicrobium zhouii]|uniref:Conserved repeat domain-containing protein n=1 Tax=Halomicrobium zhouii TaxID=767519 RepID=A0A1I6KA45_9EURY|nr:DUF58 domain-containing protein [Halomicrobium zhouii]SFR88091.1 conserved repeat domain-containing protein [Halomicrobium zhouii]
MTDADRVEILSERRTNRWVGLAGGALAAAALGLVLRSAGLLLVAGVGVALVAYERVAAPPPVSIALERRFDPAEPGVGESVTVTLTVENVGERTIADLRLADGVPDGVRVVDGDARLATALRSGAATTLTYEIRGGRERTAFDPAHVAVRDVTGVVERRARVAAATETLTWPTNADASTIPLSPRRLGAVGDLVTRDAGEGLAFHAVREHRPGDPLGRVDWHRLARTGTLATVEFQRERTATVVVVVDSRPAANLAPGEHSETAVERSSAAARTLVETFGDAGHRTGLAALGPTPCWLPPGRGASHRRRLQDRLAGHSAFAASGADSADTADTVDTGSESSDDGRGRVLSEPPGDATVVFLSPLCDGDAAAFVRRLVAREFSVAVLSPDPTAAGTTGQRLVALERRERLWTVRSLGVAVHDWESDESLDRLLTRTEGRPA